jgi:hypothetical protein
VALGLVAWSFLTLDRDAAGLREAAMAAAPAAWRQRVALDFGGITLGGLRAISGWVRAPHLDEARLALRAVEAVSVGVYQRPQGGERVSPAAFFGATDSAMMRRGWTRLLAVADREQQVAIYVPGRETADGHLTLCLAVLHARELVVVKARLGADGLGELIAGHLPAELRAALQQRRGPAETSAARLIGRGPGQRRAETPRGRGCRRCSENSSAAPSARRRRP